MTIDCIIINDGPGAVTLHERLPHSQLIQPTGVWDNDVAAAVRKAATDWCFILYGNSVAVKDLGFLLRYDPDAPEAGYPRQALAFTRKMQALCLNASAALPEAGDYLHVVAGFADKLPPVQPGEKAELASHQFVSQDSRNPAYTFDQDPAEYCYSAGDLWHVLDRGCKFQLQPFEPDPNSKGEIFQDLVKYRDDERLDVFMLTCGADFKQENWDRLREVCPRAQLFRSTMKIHGSLAALAQVTQAEHFFVVDADNWVLDGSVFDFLPRGGAQVLSTHIWYAASPIGMPAYGHGGIKIFPVYPFLTWDQLNPTSGEAATPWVDVTLGASSWVQIHTEVASEHRFDWSPEAIRVTASKEIRKLSYKAAGDPESQQRLQFWVETAKHQPQVLRAIQEQAV